MFFFLSVYLRVVETCLSLQFLHAVLGFVDGDCLLSIMGILTHLRKSLIPLAPLSFGVFKCNPVGIEPLTGVLSFAQLCLILSNYLEYPP